MQDIVFRKYDFLDFTNYFAFKDLFFFASNTLRNVNYNTIFYDRLSFQVVDKTVIMLEFQLKEKKNFLAIF